MVFGFIIRRAYPKLCSRIANGRRIWGDHPIRILHDWYQSDEALGALEAKTFRLGREHVDCLSSYGLHPTATSSNEYQVSRDNAKQWCELLLDCLVRLEDTFKTEKGRPIPPANVNEIALDLYNTMGLLKRVLSSGVVEHLITDELADNFGQRYTKRESPSSTLTGKSTAVLLIIQSDFRLHRILWS